MRAPSLATSRSLIDARLGRVQYDKVIESETYVNELLGNPKEKESLWGLITNTRVLQLKMGRIDGTSPCSKPSLELTCAVAVRFQEPWSLREFISAQAARRSSIPSSPSFDIDNNPAHKYALLRALGYQVLWDINAVAVVMPAALVGTVLLTLRGRGISRGELIRRTMWLCDAIRERGGRVADFGAMSLEEVVDRAVGVMSDLIGTHTALLEPTYFAIKRFELSFYRNQGAFERSFHQGMLMRGLPETQ